MFRESLKSFVDAVWRKIRRLRLKNHNFTLFANDCIGGVITHQLEERFNSPTVNLFFEAPAEYVTFLEHITEYINLPVEFVRTEKLVNSRGGGYPVGVIRHSQWGDVTIHFMHYSSFDEALTSWRRRCSRINLDNAFAILHLSQWDDKSIEVLRRFEKLSFRGKCLITWDGILPKNFDWHESIYIPPKSLVYHHGVLLEWKNRFRQRHIDDFDYISFLNGKKS